jgi:hypothetical protein
MIRHRVRRGGPVRRRVLAELALSLFALVSALAFDPRPAMAQGIYDELKKLQDPPSSPPSLPTPTPEELCVHLDRDDLFAKCRISYVRRGYTVAWRGLDTRSSHPLAFEVLAYDDAGALCVDGCKVPAHSLCTPLEKVR